MSRVELFEKIRRDRREGASIRELAERHHVHRRTVRQAIADAVPPVRKPPGRRSPVLGPWEATIRGWLTADLEVPVKQRHTARRVWERLVSEHGAVVAESTVRRHVAGVKAELAGAWSGCRGRGRFRGVLRVAGWDMDPAVDVRDAPVGVGEGVSLRVRQPGR